MERTKERKDPVVEEVRRAREAHAERFGYDLEAIVHDLKRHERQGEREVVSFEPKRIAPSKEAA